MTLQGSQLAYGFDGTQGRGRRLFTGLDFEVAPGQALRVAGRNGSGKTSLLRLLTGVAQPLAGEVRWQGRPLSRQREAYQRRLIYIGHAAGLKDDLSAWENVQVNALLAGQPCTRVQAMEALARLGLRDRGHLPAGVLSQGQRRRVALARLALPRTGGEASARVLVLDEPFVALDHDAVDDVSALLEAGLAQGDTLVYTTHQGQVLGGERGTALVLDTAHEATEHEAEAD
jgi:heme exporter protein A